MSGDSDYDDADILIDDHVIELTNTVVPDTNARRIRVVLNRNEKFKNGRLKAIARSMHDDPQLKTLYVWVKGLGVLGVLPETIFEAMKVLYLEGNLQRLHKIRICNERAQFLFDCFRVGQNDKQMKQIRIQIRRSITVPIELAACLHGNTHLQKLRVDIDADFTQYDASVLAAAMCNSQLTELHIHNSYCSYYIEMTDLYRILCRDGIQTSGRIWESLEINAYCARVDDMSPVAEVIPFVKTLRMRNIGQQLQTKDEMYCLFEGLERSCNLVCLGLTECRLDVDDMMMLCRALRHHRSLKELDIACNTIGDTGVSVLIEHWDEHPILESLDVSCNQVGPTGALQLVNAVMNCPSMRALNMNFNHFGLNELQMIGEQLPNLRLKELGLQVFPDDIRGDMQRAYQSLLRGLKANYFIHKLKLGLYRFDDKLGNELLFYVALSEHGRYLVTDINAVAPTIWCTILATCESHYSFRNSMIFYFLREQPHLVRPMCEMLSQTVPSRFGFGVIAK